MENRGIDFSCIGIISKGKGLSKIEVQMQGIKMKIASLALAMTLFFCGANLQAKQPDECTCWAFGYKAKVVGHTADTAKQTTFFKQCAGLEKNENKIGTESDYWAGWAAAEAKKEIVCPYTESIPTN